MRKGKWGEGFVRKRMKRKGSISTDGEEEGEEEGEEGEGGSSRDRCWSGIKKKGLG